MSPQALKRCLRFASLQAWLCTFSATLTFHDHMLMTNCKTVMQALQNVTCLDARQVAYPRHHPSLNLKGLTFEFKAFVLAYVTTFDQVLLLDADNFPLRPPDDLFTVGSAEQGNLFKQHGSLFWPDLGQKTRDQSVLLEEHLDIKDEAYTTFNLSLPWAKTSEPFLFTESGQMLFDRWAEQHLRPCCTALDSRCHRDHQGFSCHLTSDLMCSMSCTMLHTMSPHCIPCHQPPLPPARAPSTAIPAPHPMQCLSASMSISVSAACPFSTRVHRRRARHADVLEWLWFLNSHRKPVSKWMWGDKDTYRLAFALANKADDFQQVCLMKMKDQFLS